MTQSSRLVLTCGARFAFDPIYILRDGSGDEVCAQTAPTAAAAVVRCTLGVGCSPASPVGEGEGKGAGAGWTVRNFCEDIHFKL